jgi:hypothetical protein
VHHALVLFFLYDLFASLRLLYVKKVSVFDDELGLFGGTMSITVHRKKKVWKLLALLQLPITIIVILMVVWATAEINYQRPHFIFGPIQESIDKLKQSLVEFRLPVGRILGANDDFSDISLYLSDSDVEQMLNAVGEAKITGSNQPVKQLPYRKAELVIDGVQYDVKAGLKGGRRIHWGMPEHWSYKVKVDAPNSLDSYRFSIQKPVTRNYIYEWLFHELLRYEELISREYSFANFSVNGNNRGVYAIEQRVGPDLLRANNKKVGPVIGFDEPFSRESLGPDVETWDLMPVKVVGGFDNDAEYLELVAYATSLMEDFRNGILGVDEVFDAKAMGTFFAITDVLETFHATTPANLQFYLNPDTKKFEPVGYDAHFNDKQYPVLAAELHDFRSAKGFWGFGTWYARFFQDVSGRNSEFYAEYITALSRLTANGFMENFLADVDDELQRNLDFLYSELNFSDTFAFHPVTGFTPFFYYSESKLTDRRSYVSSRLERLQPPVVSVDFDDGPDHRDVYITNRNRLPLVVYGGQETYLFQAHDSRRIEGSLLDICGPDLSGVCTAKFGLPGDISVQDFSFSLAGVLDEPGLAPSIDATLAQLDMFVIDREEKLVEFRVGSWIIDSSILIPKSYALRGGAGVSLDFRAGGLLVAAGAVSLQGSGEQPFVMTSTDGLGAGLYISRGDEAASLEHVTVKDWVKSADDDIPLAPVTVVGRSLSISNCEFRNINSDMSLRLVGVRASIFGCELRDGLGVAVSLYESDVLLEGTTLENYSEGLLFAELSSVTFRSSWLNGGQEYGVTVNKRSNLLVQFVTFKDTVVPILASDDSLVDIFETVVDTSGFAEADFNWLADNNRIATWRFQER